MLGIIEYIIWWKFYSICDGSSDKHLS